MLQAVNLDLDMIKKLGAITGAKPVEISEAPKPKSKTEINASLARMGLAVRRGR